jgi:hypothetical protein
LRKESSTGQHGLVGTIIIIIIIIIYRIIFKDFQVSGYEFLGKCFSEFSKI